MGDGRLDLGQVCVLTGRFDEAREWFERARVVLDEEGSRSLRAIVDYVHVDLALRHGRCGKRRGSGGPGGKRGALQKFAAFHVSFSHCC